MYRDITLAATELFHGRYFTELSYYLNNTFCVEIFPAKTEADSHTAALVRMAELKLS